MTHPAIPENFHSVCTPAVRVYWSACDWSLRVKLETWSDIPLAHACAQVSRMAKRSTVPF